jgi:glucosylglycerate synthase
MDQESRFSTAIREHVRKRIERLRLADIVIGIPSYFSGSTIGHVIRTVAEGLSRHYGDLKAVIMVADGGSTDDSREIASLVQIHSYNIEKIVTIYRGIPGKGSGLRAIFEVADFLKAKVVAVLDSDLVSIKPGWIKNVVAPVMAGYDLATPYYQRFKLDGTITNTVAYNLTRALYGLRIRQPIGGDFGISHRLVKLFLDQDVWETDAARFGIDIWMTTTAIVNGFQICQSRLGTKIHGEKDPAADLCPMFRQVVGTTFQLMEQHEPYWTRIEGSKEVPILGDDIVQDPAPFEIDRGSLVEYFNVGFRNFHTLWQRLLDQTDMDVIRGLHSVHRKNRFILPVDTWARIVYRYAAAFQSTPRQRFKVLDTMLPLYHARVASLSNELKEMSSEESERFFESNAAAFEEAKSYLLSIWKKEV